jgi:hypothetical protein
VSGIKLLALQKPTAQILAKELQAAGLLSTDQIYEILTIQMKESGWQFVEIAIKLGYLSGRKVEQAMKLLQTYNVVSTKPKLLHPTNKL